MTSPKTFIAQNRFPIIYTILLVTALLMISYGIERKFLTAHCHFYDPLAYDVYNIQLSQNAALHGRWQAILGELTSNTKNPLRTIPFLILAPELLAKPWGHLLSEAPCIWSFAFFLSYYIQQKLQSKIAGLAACLLFITIPGLIDPHLGLGANWLDMPAAASMGAGLISLLLLAETRDARWGWGVGGFFTITACVRWCAAFYYIAAAGPIVLAVLFFNRRDKSFLRFSFLNMLVSAALGLIFTFSFARDNFTYYHVYSYSLYSEILFCWVSMCLALKLFMGVAPLEVMASLAVMFAVWRWNRLGLTNLFSWLAVFTFPVATAFFICVGVRISEAVHPMLYMVPALIVAICALIPKIKLNEGKKVRNAIFLSSTALILLLTGIWTVNLRKTMKALHVVSLIERRQKRLDEIQAAFLGENQLKAYVQFDDERMMPGIEAFRKYGFLPEFAGNCFSIHEAYWRGFYPNQQAKQITEAVYLICKNSVNLVTIHSSEKDIDNNKILDNPISVTVSKYMTRHIPLDRNWQRLGSVQGPYGQMCIYKNRKL